MKTEPASEFVVAATTKVEQAMHPGVLTCSADVPLREVARLMALYRVHAIVCEHAEEVGPGRWRWGVVSDLDLVAAATADEVDGLTARSAARTPVVTITRNASLREAAALMARKRVSHLLVVSSSAGRPLGILSGLDVARVLALEPGFGS